MLSEPITDKRQVQAMLLYFDKIFGDCLDLLASTKQNHLSNLSKLL